MKHPKPGKKEKSTKIRNSKRLHDIKQPDQKHCRRCDWTTQTERFAHYEGFRRSEFGKGGAVKCNDNMTAWLCQKCTDIMDHRPSKYEFPNYLSNIDNERVILKHSEEWLYLICKTHLL